MRCMLMCRFVIIIGNDGLQAYFDALVFSCSLFISGLTAKDRGFRLPKCNHLKWTNIKVGAIV